MVTLVMVWFVFVVGWAAIIYAICKVMTFNHHEDEEMERLANHDFTSPPRAAERVRRHEQTKDKP